jgi:hypothetical protein
MTELRDLPQEVLLHIFRHVAPYWLGRCRRVSKLWYVRSFFVVVVALAGLTALLSCEPRHAVSSDPYIWQRLVRARWSFSRQELYPLGPLQVDTLPVVDISLMCGLHRSTPRGIRLRALGGLGCWFRYAYLSSKTKTQTPCSCMQPRP